MQKKYVVTTQQKRLQICKQICLKHLFCSQTLFFYQDHNWCSLRGTFSPVRPLCFTTSTLRATQQKGQVFHMDSGEGPVLVAVLRHPGQHLEVSPAVRGPLHDRRPRPVRPHLHPRLCPGPPGRRDEHDRGRQEHERRCGEEVQSYPL